MEYDIHTQMLPVKDIIARLEIKMVKDNYNAMVQGKEEEGPKHESNKFNILRLICLLSIT